MAETADVPLEKFEAALARPDKSERRDEAWWLWDKSGNRNGRLEPHPERQSPALGTKRDSRPANPDQ
jgi:hypothetical protein